MLIAKIVPYKAQVDDNVNTLARLVTQYGAILASAPILTEIVSVSAMVECSIDPSLKLKKNPSRSR